MTATLPTRAEVEAKLRLLSEIALTSDAVDAQAARSRQDELIDLWAVLPAPRTGG